MEKDVIEKFGASTIQHGKYNDRIYLMKLDPEEGRVAPKNLIAMARDKGYSKVFAKVPAPGRAAFAEAGYEIEASVPRFYDGETEAFFMSRFLAEDRRQSVTPERNERVMDACEAKASERTDLPLPDGYVCKQCREADVKSIAALYREVFPTYPFPIHDPDYIRETMRTHVIYFGIWHDNRLVALSSAEMDQAARNVEMTDFATLPEHRGMNFATILLGRMERVMARRDMATAYTIARSKSFGMNITFARRGYRMGGRLINNTNIGGGFEDMNVWHRPLTSQETARTPEHATASESD